MHFQLFSYLKIFCNFVSKFKFENCYAYDKGQRTQLAAQADTHQHHHTTSWDSINDDLFNMYLRDNYLPSCFHCSSYGHYATACPFKNNSQNNNFRSSSNNQYSYIANNNSNFRGPNSSNFRGPNSLPLQSTSTQSSDTSNQTPCTRFNHSGNCAKPPCRFAHICNKCHRPGHTGNRCFANTSSTFRP